MRSLRITFTLYLTLACLLLPAMASHHRRHTVRAHARRTHHHASRHHSTRHDSTSRHARTHSSPTRASKRHASTAQAKPQRRRPGYSSTASAGITPLRATEIQNALIRAGYLRSGSGVWDAETIAAMRRYQQDHQWQTRLVPDARALIALGLGPRRDQRALYPVVASTAPPVPATRPSEAPDTETP